VWTKSQFSAPQTTKSILDGVGELHLVNNDEVYYITFPTYYAHNLLLGTLRMEIGDSYTVYCPKTKLKSVVNFTQRGMFTSAGLNGVNGTISQDKDVLFSFEGTWDKSIEITNMKTKQKSEYLDVTKQTISPKYVLPISLEGPWESRRLWQNTTIELTKRPTVDWSKVDREKAQLEEEQRLLACHSVKESSPQFKQWGFKKFHPKKTTHPITGKEVELFVFDGFDEIVKNPSSCKLNVLDLSRTLPDPRGGLNGAGAQEDVVKAMRSVTLSKRRIEGFQEN
jgi:Oxysterol-binding protein